MVTKLALILIFGGACLAYPAEEEVRPMNGPSPVGPAQPLSEPPIGPGAPLPGSPFPIGPLSEPPVGSEALLPGSPSGSPQPPPQSPLPEGNSPDLSDLKTDSTFWWRRRYFPSYYPRSRYYYRPRSYTTYSYYTPYYSYWSPYYWW